eukprot:3752512-Ditylum_brightwellii.AAC.1
MTHDNLDFILRLCTHTSQLYFSKQDIVFCYYPQGLCNGVVFVRIQYKLVLRAVGFEVEVKDGIGAFGKL